MLTRLGSYEFKQKTTKSNTPTREVLAGSSKILTQGYGVFVSDSELLLASNSDSLILQYNYSVEGQKRIRFF